MKDQNQDKEYCEPCQGTGRIPVYDEEGNIIEGQTKKCPFCAGTGMSNTLIFGVFFILTIISAFSIYFVNK